MYFVYHGVPEPIRGTRLMPLSQMQANMSDIRKKSLDKYEGRKEVLERKIPLLGCLWNDVVQFLPLHPQKVFTLQQDLGLIPSVPPYKFYEIALAKLDPTKTVVFFKSAPGDENIEVKWLSEVDFASLQEIPEATVSYYKTLIGTGELPFNYQFVPHVVFRGSLDVSDASVITLKQL